MDATSSLSDDADWAHFRQIFHDEYLPKLDAQAKEILSVIAMSESRRRRGHDEAASSTAHQQDNSQEREEIQTRLSVLVDVGVEAAAVVVPSVGVGPDSDCASTVGSGQSGDSAKMTGDLFPAVVADEDGVVTSPPLPQSQQQTNDEVDSPNADGVLRAKVSIFFYPDFGLLPHFGMSQVKIRHR